LLSEIILFINTKFADCQKINIDYGMQLNCIAEYNYFNFANDLSKHRYLYADEIISKYAIIPTLKDLYMVKWTSQLQEEGFLKHEDNKYIIEYLKKRAKYEEINKVYSQLFELGLYLQELYLLNDVIKNENVNIDSKHNYGIRRLCSRIQDYLYLNERDYNFVSHEIELNSFSVLERNSSDYLNTKHKEFLMLLQQDLVEDYSLDDLINLRHKRINQLFNWGVDETTRELLDKMNKMLLDKIEKNIECKINFVDVKERVNKELKDKVFKVNKKLRNYLGEKFAELEFDEAIKSIITSLATGEFLYELYVESTVENKIDYSCIALEYYSSLEQTVNLLLYTPYKIKVLEPKYGLIANNEFKTFMGGYVGFSDERYFVMIKGNQRWIKSSQELGNISFMYKDMLNGRNDLKNQYIQIGKFLDDLQIDKIVTQNIGKMIFEIKDLRNEAAHGGEVLDVIKAKKAQDVSYIHHPYPDPQCRINMADNCHKLILNIMNLF